MFEYDTRVSLDIEELSPLQDRDGITVRDIAYASPRGGKVTAYLVAPEGSGPFAGVLYLHPGQWDRSCFVEEAIALARRGAVGLSVDAPVKRPPRLAVRHPRTAQGHLARWTQMIVDLQRGLDLLTSRPDVDPERIGYVGHSYGATLGGVLAGIEKRVRAYVLMAGLVAHSEWWRSGEHEYYRHFREQVSAAQVDEMGETMAPLDAIHYIGHAAPAALLFQFARHDQFISEHEALRYWRAASEPKEIRWYDTDHFFDDRARQERMAWLGERLGLSAA
ncbi:MAG: alpha/beta hydrolase family protein [Anaerolineae bacterium]